MSQFKKLDINKITTYNLHEVKPTGEDSKDYEESLQHCHNKHREWFDAKSKMEGMIEARKILNKEIAKARKLQQKKWEEYNVALAIKESVAGRWQHDIEEYKKENGLENTYKVTDKLHISGRGQVFVIANPKELESEKYSSKWPTVGDEIIQSFQKYQIVGVESFRCGHGITRGPLGLVVRKLNSE